jgi:hypothetical protein
LNGLLLVILNTRIGLFAGLLQSLRSSDGNLLKNGLQGHLDMFLIPGEELSDGQGTGIAWGGGSLTLSQHMFGSLETGPTLQV